MRVRRLHKRPAALEITAFLNLIVVLVPFLLSTAVFSRLAVLQVSLPAQAGGLANVKNGNLQLEVVIRPDALVVGDRNGGLIQRLPNTDKGADVRGLNALLEQVKARFPERTEASVLAEPATPYDLLVQVMDAVRTGQAVQGVRVVPAELFPDISVGDAPVLAGGAK